MNRSLRINGGNVPDRDCELVKNFADIGGDRAEQHQGGVFGGRGRDAEMGSSYPQVNLT